MKLLIYIAFVFAISIVSCTKNVNDQQPNIPIIPIDTTVIGSVIGRLQVKWQVVSITQKERNGPGVFQYIGSPSDYMHFGRDSIYTFVQGIQDDVKYHILSDSSTFVFGNGSSPKPSDTLFIRTLTDHILVFDGVTDAGDIGIVSLKR